MMGKGVMAGPVYRVMESPWVVHDLCLCYDLMVGPLVLWLEMIEVSCLVEV